MKNILRCATLCFLFCSCQTNDSRIVSELEAVLDEIATEKLEYAEGLYVAAYDRVLSDQYPMFSGIDPRDSLTFGAIQEIHDEASRFYGMADSLENDAAELQARFVATATSLRSHDRGNLKVVNRIDTSARATPLLRNKMRIHIATLEASLLEQKLQDFPVRIFDDFSSPYFKKVGSSKNTYTLTVHYRAIQQFQNMKLTLDTILFKEKVIKPDMTISHEDVLAVVSFRNLQPGNYRITGRVRYTDRSIQEKPFSYSFVIPVKQRRKK